MNRAFAGITGIRFAFGNAAHPIPEAFAHESLLQRKQVHGTRVVEVMHTGQQCGEADGFLTWQKGVTVNVITADCLPVLFARLDGGGVAAVHAGWKGLLEGVLEAMIERIGQQDDPARWACLIGPAAGACCYEVEELLVQRFLERLPHISADIIAPRYRHLDLQAIAQARLVAAGIGKVERLSHCTICSQGVHSVPLYNSYRRHGSGVTNQHACIMRL